MKIKQNPNLKLLLKIILIFILCIGLTAWVDTSSKDFINIEKTLATFASLFSGLILALMAMSSDLPVELSWKKKSIEAGNAINRLKSLELLFRAYILTLGLILLSNILGDMIILEGSEYAFSIQYILRKLIIFVGCLAFMFSLFLPKNIYFSHITKINDEVKRSIPKTD